jgi:hypothetical protein
MLRSGRLAGRKVGPVWLVDSAEVQRAVREKAPSGRPLNPAQTWGVLDLLGGGDAPWLDAVGRSRARVHARGLAGADASRWRAVLRRRQERIPCRVHPAALQRLLDVPGVVAAGAGAAAAAGADLVVLKALPEVYVSPAQWPDLARRLAIRRDEVDPNLVVRVPADVWPSIPTSRSRACSCSLPTSWIHPSRARSVPASRRSTPPQHRSHRVDAGDRLRRIATC